MSKDTDLRELYIDLLQRLLINSVYGQAEAKDLEPWSLARRLLIERFANRGIRLMYSTPMDTRSRVEGRDWSPVAHTMIGIKRLSNVRLCVEQVVAQQIPGDLIETGVWRGGTCIFMRGLLKAFGDVGRIVWVADSFKGLPRPNAEKYPQDAADRHFKQPELAVSLEQVQQNFEAYGLLDEQVRFLPGWFSDTLPSAPIERLAVLRLDGDMYESTIDALTSLYPKLSPGGFCIIDDYALSGCRQAVTDYREQHDIKEEIVDIDWTGVYWQKG